MIESGDSQAAPAHPQSSPESLGERDFERIRATVASITGISIAPTKRLLIYRRLAGRLKARGFASFGDYLSAIESGDRNELEHFINAITTNQTSFFREKHHFDFLRRTIIPELADRHAGSKQRLRMWSAGCSSGEEPYSIAMTLADGLPDIANRDARLLCTDLDSSVVAVGKAGVYPASRVEPVPESYRSRYLDPVVNGTESAFRVRKEIRALTVFKRLNLLGPWPMKGRFDVIFCRNVCIYFERETKRELIERFWHALDDDGYLVLGHSESLYDHTDRFSLVGNTIYRKVPRP